MENPSAIIASLLFQHDCDMAYGNQLPDGKWKVIIHKGIRKEIGIDDTPEKAFMSAYNSIAQFDGFNEPIKPKRWYNKIIEWFKNLF